MEYAPVWLKRICNVNVDEAEMESINYPRTEYTRHVCFKSAEFLGIVGVLRGAYPDSVVKIFTRAAPRWFKMKVILAEIAQAGGSSLALGFLLGPFVAAFMVNGLMMSEIYKTCYRLRNDQSEIRRDRWSIVGGVSGAATGYVSGYAFKLTKGFICGGAIGTSVGCLTAIAYSYVLNDVSNDDDVKKDGDSEQASDEAIDS